MKRLKVHLKRFMIGYMEDINMNTEEKESIKNDIMIEVNEKIQSLKDIITIKNAEQDEKINKLCYISETQSRNLDKV